LYIYFFGATLALGQRQDASRNKKYQPNFSQYQILLPKSDL